MRWKYDQETRDRVVRLYVERRDAYPAESIRGTLRYLNELVGVSPETIRSWVRKAQQEQEVRASGVSVTEREEILVLRREVAELKRANEILKTASAFFRGGRVRRQTQVVIQFIAAYQQRFGVEPICRVLHEVGIQIAPSSYYAAMKRGPSVRQQSDEVLVPVVQEIHAANYACYGIRKMWKALQRLHYRVGREQVARLMKLAGVQSRVRTKRVNTTQRCPGVYRHPDLVMRGWDTKVPNVVWVADFTYVRTSLGMVYVSFLQDAASRHILGFTVSHRQTTDLVLKAVDQAVSVRKRLNPAFTGDGVIHHSDAGSHYRSLSFGENLAKHGLAGSIGRVGTAYDNALMESTIGLYKTELIHANNKKWSSRQEVETATVAWVRWFNHERLHSTLNYLTPVEFEEAYNQRVLPRQVA